VFLRTSLPPSLGILIHQSAEDHKLSSWIAPDAFLKHQILKPWGSEGIAAHILNLGTMWRWVVSFTLWPLYSQGRSTHWIGSWVCPRASGGERKKYLPLLEIKPLLSSP